MNTQIFKLIIWILMSQYCFAKGMNPQAFLDGPAKLTGNGCPAGSYSVTFSPDLNTLSVLFDRYKATTNPSETIALQACWVQIHVQVTEGYHLKFAPGEYRGFVTTGPLSRAQFSSWSYVRKNTFIQSSPFDSLFFRSNTEEDFSFNPARNIPIRWCGGRFELGFFSAVTIQNRRNSSSELNIDSFDFSLLNDKNAIDLIPCR